MKQGGGGERFAASRHELERGGAEHIAHRRLLQRCVSVFFARRCGKSASLSRRKPSRRNCRERRVDHRRRFGPHRLSLPPWYPFSLLIPRSAERSGAAAADAAVAEPRRSAAEHSPNVRRRGAAGAPRVGGGLQRPRVSPRGRVERRPALPAAADVFGAAAGRAASPRDAPPADQVGALRGCDAGSSARRSRRTSKTPTPTGGCRAPTTSRPATTSSRCVSCTGFEQTSDGLPDPFDFPVAAEGSGFDSLRTQAGFPPRGSSAPSSTPICSPPRSAGPPR